MIVIPNPVDVDWMCPPSMAKERLRVIVTAGPMKTSCSFRALGHFERKGPSQLLFEALGKIDDESEFSLR